MALARVREALIDEMPRSRRICAAKADLAPFLLARDRLQMRLRIRRLRTVALRDGQRPPTPREDR